ncbi:MAG: helix-turn-helix transcriptional regulator [Pseudomonadota bacterium]
MSVERLREHLDKNDLKVSDFAEQAGLGVWDISRLLSGARKKPSTRIALGIEKATDGKISFRSWFDATQPDTEGVT